MAFPDEFHNRAVPVGDQKDLVLHQEFPLIFPRILPVGHQGQVQTAHWGQPYRQLLEGTVGFQAAIKGHLFRFRKRIPSFRFPILQLRPGLL